MFLSNFLNGRNNFQRNGPIDVDVSLDGIYSRPTIGENVEGPNVDLNKNDPTVELKELDLSVDLTFRLV